VVPLVTEELIFFMEHDNVHVELPPFVDAQCVLTAYRVFGNYMNL
jgi:hypothetical protein